MAIPKGAQKAGKVQPAKAIKEGQVKKNKQQKFKQTPKGKVQLVHDKKNGNANVKKAIINSPKKSNNKQADNKNSSNNSNKKQAQKKKNAALKKSKEEEEDDDDSDEDINEGVAIPEDLSGMEDDEDDDDDDDESSDDEKLNLLGESLADDSDDDDDDFEADSDEEASSNVNKGVKMFKGLKSVGKSESAEGEDDDEDDDDDDDDDDSEDEEMDLSAASLNTSMSTDGTDDDEDDDDDDDDDDSDSDNDGPGLKALLGNSLVDEDDDEDFEGDEDDDEDEDIDDSEEEDEPLNVSTTSNNSNLSAVSEEGKVLTPEQKAELDKRSIYVGNVPKDIKESRIKSEFGKFGPIENFRIRGVVPENPKMSYKAAAIKKKFHKKSSTICVFIVYKSEDSAVKALSMNGKQLDGFYLRVDRVNQEKKRDPKKSVFLGNLPFDTEDNELWEMFLKCGKIEDVRTVRDRMSGSCRGIAYINFKTDDGATLALDLNETELRGRQIRVQRYQPQAANSNQNKFKPGNKRSHGKKHFGGSPKKAKQNDEVENNTVKPKGMKNEKKPRNAGETAKQASAPSDDSFQGQTADAKKKGKKANKFEKKKKNMAGKLMSKPKKPIS